MSTHARYRDNAAMRRYSIVEDDGVLWIGRNNGAATPWMPAFSNDCLQERTVRAREEFRAPRRKRTAQKPESGKG